METHFLAQMFPSDCYLGLLGLQMELPFQLSAGVAQVAAGARAQSCHSSFSDDLNI